MLPLLIGWGAKALARPAMALSVVGALAAGGYGVYHYFAVDRALRNQVEDRDKAIAEKDKALVAAALVESTVRRALEEQRAETITVTRKLDAQSAEVRAFALKAKASDATAAKLAIDVLRAGEREVDAIRANTDRPSGHESLNQALAERFAR